MALYFVGFELKIPVLLSGHAQPVNHGPAEALYPNKRLPWFMKGSPHPGDPGGGGPLDRAKERAHSPLSYDAIHVRCEERDAMENA